MSKNLLIVESPAKAKTIEKYLGSDFHVLSSVGHIRTDTKVDPDDDFKVTYEIDPDHKKVVSELKKAVKSSDTVWLATDEDREGEAISWHLQQVLKLPEDVKRITFHEITKPALEEAIKNPRAIDQDMVQSQMARQTLDMLVGYDLSGVVRKKVPGAKSAGRVQSPALRLVVEREKEIEAFDQKFNFKITGVFLKNKHELNATLDKLQPETEQDAENLLNNLKDSTFTVSNIEKTQGKRANPTPLTTAAMQIEASSRLGFSASTTMRAAQALYQAGLITYHRTDSLNLSNQALGQIAHFIEENYGKNYLQVRHFHTKDTSAQEAHEAIRPTNINTVSAGKNDYEKKLYNLIRTRTLATQMANAIVDKTTIKIADEKQHIFIAKGEIVTFDGFLKVYGSSKDLELPEVKQGDILIRKQITARQTFAKPPARYTEGSLVKKLEELGIGRPSTYASIMSALQARDYIKKGESEGRARKVIEYILEDDVKKTTTTEKSGATKGKLIPTPIGELLSGFLTDHFNNIVDYGFTANIEQELDQVAEAKLNRVKMLRDFYGPFSKTVQDSDDVERYNNARELGQDPKTKKPIFAKIGRHGGFIQLGENEKSTGEKPRFAPLPKGKSVKTVTLEQAIKQLDLPALPRSLGKAKDGTEIIAAAGPFGPYLKAGKYNITIKDKDPYTITFKEAEPLYQAKIDSIIADWGDIMIINGAYGPYIKGPSAGRGRRNNLKVPEDIDPKTITKSQAEEMLKNKPKTRRRPARRTRKKK